MPNSSADGNVIQRAAPVLKPEQAPEAKGRLPIAGPVAYATYTNARFGFSVQYPAGLLIPHGESVTGDGQAFLSNDRQESLLTYGSHASFAGPADQTSLQQTFREHLRLITTRTRPVTVTHKALQNDWYVISGHNGDKIFYEKQFLLGNRYFISVSMSYPADQQELWDIILSEVIANFQLSSRPYSR